MSRRLIPLAVCSVLLSGCAGSALGSQTFPTTLPPLPSALPSLPSITLPSVSLPPLPSLEPPSLPSGLESAPAQLWDNLVKDLRARGVPLGKITLVSAKSVTWPDGSLGCPEPGTSYTQAQEPGWQVVITVDGKTYDYRFGRAALPRLCTSGATAGG